MPELFIFFLFFLANQGNQGNNQQQQQQSDDPQPPPPVVTTNFNAVTVDYEYSDGQTKSYVFFAKQDKPTEADGESPLVPIEARVYFAENELQNQNISEVSIVGSTTIQPPSIKSINKSDLTSRMFIELPNPTGVSVSFGFYDKAGIAQYTLVNTGTNALVASGQVDMHSTSDTDLVSIKSVELIQGLDERETYMLEIKHTGLANPSVFDSGFDHPIYVGDVLIHRTANTDRSIIEFVSNNAFVNDVFPDDGSRNSVTGRLNFVEFYNVQNVITDGLTNEFQVNSATQNVRKVELDNGRGFFELNQNIDWVFETIDPDRYLGQVALSDIPKAGAALRITYDVFSFALQRKIEITQPETYDGRYDRYNDIYVQNEAVYIEVRSQENL